MKPIKIIATGMCTAVGNSTQASMAAIRAGMAHFQETEFYDGGKPIIGGQVYQLDTWGPDRLITLLSRAMEDCLAEQTLDQKQAILLLLLPKLQSPGVNTAWLSQLTTWAADTYQIKVQPFFSGKAGIGYAMQEVSDILKHKEYKQILLAGVDSYFTATTINHYLEEKRLLTHRNSNGFIPGEGAGVVWLEQAEPEEAGIHIIGTGYATEEAYVLQTEKKLKGIGLTKAIREALAKQVYKMSDLNFHMGDVSGENYYFRELSIATNRCLDKKIPNYPRLLLADYAGETGAACAPLILASTYNLFLKENSLGTKALLHFSADSGERAALIMESKQKEKING